MSEDGPSRSRRAPRLTLSVQRAVRGEGLPLRADVMRWLRAALERDAEITVRFVAEAEGRELNRDYRGKDYATNVLTFVYDDFPQDDSQLHGDLVLCLPVVAREAAEQGKPIAAHFAHLLVHGVLHLQGYDHEEDAAAEAMERRESEIVRDLGYPDPYATERIGV